jgi:hypothetical protein
MKTLCLFDKLCQNLMENEVKRQANTTLYASFNQVVGGSIPPGLTKFLRYFNRLLEAARTRGILKKNLEAFWKQLSA